MKKNHNNKVIFYFIKITSFQLNPKEKGKKSNYNNNTRIVPINLYSFD